MTDKHTLSILAALFVLVAVPPAYGETLTRTTAFEYDPATGLLIREVVEPDNSALCLVTTYTYDPFGNRDSATTRNCNGTSSGGLTEAAAPTGYAVFQSRTVSTTYAAGSTVIGGTTYSWSAGQFPTTNRNALYSPTLNHQETREYDPRFGAPTKLTGPNGLPPTTWTYDGFGRKTSETRADGTSTTWTYNICNACAGLQYSKYSVTEASSGKPSRTTYFDSLNREIRTETQGFDGTSVLKDTEYDSLGRVSRVSKPYYSSPVWTTYSYDPLGRVNEVVGPTADGKTARTFTSYNGLETTVTVTSAEGGANVPGISQTRMTKKNSQGQVVQVRDVGNTNVFYTYDPFGNLKTTNAAGVVTTHFYDLRGRRIQMHDFDMGYWIYEYNALGEVVQQIDAKFQITNMTYDKLGRMTQRTQADLVSNWSYDTCNKGIGKLCQVTASNNYNRTMAYDGLGRVSTVTTTIDTPYQVSYTYDALGRLNTTTYPTTSFAVQNVYNPRGYLWKVQRVNDPDPNPDNTVYWTANAMNAAGKVTSESLGNGLNTSRTYDALFQLTAEQSGAVHNVAYTFDAIGNVVQRKDNVQAIEENFVYDQLNRLIHASGPGLTSRSFGYNILGNMTFKSDVGSYSYQSVGMSGPHAVSSVGNGGAANSIAATYGYDANGSMISASGTIYPSSGSVSFSRTLTYTGFNMPATINQTQGSNSYSYAYTYGADHERVRLVTVRLDDTYTSIYLHPAGKGALLYEKEIRQSDGRIEHKHYVNGGSGIVGVFVTKSSYGPGEGAQMRYYHRDHLGSVAVITNPSGAVIERLAYEAYGERRNTNGTPQDRSSPLIGITTDRGFTAHEHLDELNLIHMNGRIYDPAIGRFITADPFVQQLNNLQSYNRYSYVLNSPLMYTDPSGYLSLRRVARSVGAAVARAVHSSTAAVVGEGTANRLLENRNFSLSGFMREGADVLAAGGLAGGYVSPRQMAEFVREQPFQRAFDDVIMKNPTLYTIGQWVATAATSWSCMGCGGAIWAMYYTSISTGSSSSAIRVGAITFATNYVGGQIAASGMPVAAQVVAHGVVGGFSAELQGGDFQDGFVRSATMAGVSSGVSHLVSQVFAYTEMDGPAPQREVGGFRDAVAGIRDNLSIMFRMGEEQGNVDVLASYGARAYGVVADRAHPYYTLDSRERREEQR